MSLEIKDTAIEVMEQSLKTHEDWLEYYEKHPLAESLPENKNAGNAVHQRMCITNYKKAIAEIKADKQRIAELEAENKESHDPKVQMFDELVAGIGDLGEFMRWEDNCNCARCNDVMQRFLKAAKLLAKAKQITESAMHIKEDKAERES
jgi:hypothetical protein